jgi:hypothetical protein
MIIRLSSDRHDPQLVPARVVWPMSATVRTAPQASALRTSSTPTPKQAQITGSVAMTALSELGTMRAPSSPASAAVRPSAGNLPFAGPTLTQPSSAPSMKEAAR